MCNGGGNAKAGGNTAYNEYGGNGGSGGSFRLIDSLMLTTEPTNVVIGSAGGATSFGEFLADQYTGATGGTGFNQYAETVPNGENAQISTLPFLDSYFTDFPCAGGSGGFQHYSYNSYVSYGGGGGNGDISQTVKKNGKGGVTGGGSIDRYGAEEKKYRNATYYGSGGCGGSCDAYGSSNKSYNVLIARGTGYQGVVIIRIPVEQ